MDRYAGRTPVGSGLHHECLYDLQDRTYRAWCGARGSQYRRGQKSPPNAPRETAAPPYVVYGGLFVSIRHHSRHSDHHLHPIPEMPRVRTRPSPPWRHFASLQPSLHPGHLSRRAVPCPHSSTVPVDPSTRRGPGMTSRCSKREANNDVPLMCNTTIGRVGMGPAS
jgi:hypothetical protein